MMGRAFWLWLILVEAAGAQQEWVSLQRAQARLALAQQELERTQALARQGLVSAAELSRQEAEVNIAKLDYQEALWQFQGSRLRVVVAECLRNTGADGLDKISLLLHLPPLGLPQGAVPEKESQLGVADLQVSLVEKGVVVGYPYAVVVPYLSPGDKVEVVFQLLRPVETPTVALEYRGRREEVTLFPRVAASDVPFRMTVAQPSLAITFGEEGRFLHTLEPLQPGSLTVDLQVRGLPASCTVRFLEQPSGASVSSLRLGAGTGSKRLELAVRLPPGPTTDVPLDVPLEFALVAQYHQGGRTGNLVQKLRITPVGIPRLELRASSWLVEAEAGAEIPVSIEVVNTGSAPAREVKVLADTPEGLTAKWEPPEWQMLGAGEKTRGVLLVGVAKGAVAGEYSLRLQPRAANRSAAAGEGEAQLRVRVRAARGWVLPLVLALFLAALAVAGVRLVKKLRLD